MAQLKLTNPILIGILSDTHGWIPPSVATAFDGVDVIIHAGDVDEPQVLDELQKIAPVIGVRGNMDHGAWADDLPSEEWIELGHKIFYILHDLHRLDLTPGAADIDVVVHGHTHRPDRTRKDGVLYLNPGSASYPRAGTAPSVFLVRINGSDMDVRHIDLDEPKAGHDL